MKKKCILFLVLMIAIFLCSCAPSQSSKDGDDNEAKQETVVQREQAKDYNDNTNKEYKTAGFIIHIPSAWEEGAQEGGYYAEKGEGSGFLNIASSDYAVSTREDLEKIMDSFLEGMRGSFSELNCSEPEHLSHDTTGLPCALIEIAGTLEKEKLKTEGYALFLVDEENEKILVVSYLESVNTKKSHMDDAVKVMANISKNPDIDASSQGTAEETGNGIRPEIKELLDSYESFVDEYVSFMQSYDSSDTLMLVEYMELLSKASDYSEKIDALEDADLTDEELLYYTEVTMRASQKMLEASITLD